VNSKNILFSIDNYDDGNHQSHSQFCEMDELHWSLDNDVGWKEAARWIKFEESVEHGGRWSKPHVATLSLHYLFKLRVCLVDALIKLDLECNDLQSIINNLLDEMVQSGKLNSLNKEQMKSLLLRRHCHQHEKEYKLTIDQGEKKSLPLIKSVKSIANMTKKNSKKDLKDTENCTSTNLKPVESKSKVKPYHFDHFLISLQINYYFQPL
jgi:hypothetical protein